MEATARMPGNPGSTQNGHGAGEHIHRLLALADALATAASPTTNGQQSPTVPFGLDLASLSDAESIRWAQSLERLNHFLQGLLVQGADDLNQRVDAGRFATTGVRNTAGLLVQSLKLSRAEAYRRLRLAERVLPTTDPLTTILAPAPQPVLGAAFFTGELSIDQALTVSGFIDDADHLATAARIPEQQRQEVEQTLTGQAREQAPDFLRTIGTRILAHLDPDGQQPTQGALLAKQGLIFHQPRRGLIHFEGHLTIPQYETLRVTIDWAANPHHPDTTPTSNDDGTSTPTGEVADADDSDGGSLPNDRAGEACRDGAHDRDRTDVPGQESLFGNLTTISHLFNHPTHNTPTPTGTPTPAGTPSPGLPTGDGETIAANAPTTATGTGGRDTRECEDGIDGTGTVPAGSTAANDPGETTQPPVPAPEAGPLPGPTPESGPEPAPPARTAPPSGLASPPLPEPVSPAGPAPGSGSGSENDASLWVEAGTDPGGIGWRTTSSTVGDDLSWLWGDPAPVTRIGWDEPPTRDTTTTPGCLDSATIPDSPHPTPTVEPTQTRNHPNPDPTHATHAAGSSTGTGTGPWLMDPYPDPGFNRAPEPLEAIQGWDPIDPANTDPAIQDRRTPAQRLLDGLIDCVKLAGRTGKLPAHGGLKTQLIITTTQADLDRHATDGTGIALAPFSGPVPLAVFDEALCDVEITQLLYGTGQEILDVGRTQRLFTRAQRKILLARDMGCSFPGCIIPAYRCEAHHIIPWYGGGATSIENGCLLCTFHHHQLHHTDWKVELLHGTPHFTAPYKIDPTAQARRNNYHHGLTTNP
ncbi:MAG: DUF222 domain-containing protein [Specibacter sp.]